MKLFYHLYGYLLLGMIIVIGIDESLCFKAEIEQYEADMISNAIQDGKSISGMIAHIWKESGETKALELLRDASESGSIKIRWVWPHILLADPDLSKTEKNLLHKVRQGQTVSFIKDYNESPTLRHTYVPVDLGQTETGALELSQTLGSFHEYYKRMLTRAITIAALLALGYGLILYYFIDRKIRFPLNRLMAQAERIGQGDLSLDQNIVGDDELSEMAQTMNDMCSRLLIARDKINFEYNARLNTLEQLRHTERLSSFAVLAAEIAHELGTPLNVVDGRAKMIINEALQKEETHDCARIIVKQSERMTIIIRQLLDFTRRPKQHISADNFALLVKQVFQLLYPMAKKQQVSFQLDRAEDTEVLFSADFSQLQQVLVNLLMNSIQAMPEGGKVIVSLSNERLPTSLSETRVKLKYMKLSIHDEGEGISKKDLDHIFTPFFTTKNIGTGTGLGLSIAHGIVEEHGGWIEVEGNIPKGACFTVYLPMEEQKR